MDIEKAIFSEAEDALPEEFASMSADDIQRRIRLMENEIPVLNVSLTPATWPVL